MSNHSTLSSADTFHRKLLLQFIHAVQQHPPFIDDDCDEDLLDYLHQLEQLPSLPEPGYSEQGQAVLCRIIASLPHLTPLIPRDLLWHFGGDCLHFMPDDEIATYQHLDEKRYTAEAEGTEFNYESERARLLGLH